MAWTFEATRAGYGKLWREAAIRPEDYAEATAAANKIIANEQRYKQIQAVTGGVIPWFWVGAIHNRENSNSFAGHLHNGDPLTGYTTHVPANRPQIGHGPPFTWEESALDVLQWKNLDEVKDWPVERMLLEAELYNGLGYALYKKINSPYVWAATTLQQRGKYTVDGPDGYDANHWDTQLGVAAILKRLAEMRPDIAAALRADAPAGGPVTETAPAPAANNLLPVMLTMMMALLQRQQNPGAAQPDIMAMLRPLLEQLTGRPIPLPPPAIEPPKPPVTAPPPATGANAIDARVGIVGVLGSLLASYFGIMGPPAGAGSTTTGMLTPTLIGLGAAGGLPSMLMNLAGGLFNSFIQRRAAQK